MNSSPDIFQPFNPEAVKDTGFEGSYSEPKDSAFQVTEALWTTIQGDAVLKRNLDRLIDERVGTEIRARVQAGERELREATIKEARETGLAEARAEARAESGQLRSEMEIVCQKVIEAGLGQLNAHEVIWVRSLSLLLKRFLVPNDSQIVPRLQKWMRESLEGLSDHAEVRVFLPPAQYERLADTLGASGKGWIWKCDPALNEGDVRCETEMGGVIFSPGEQAARLERIVEEIVGEARVAARSL